MKQPTLKKPTILRLNLLVALLCTIGTCLFAQSNSTQPNILLIIADDLGIDYATGYQNNAVKPNTPTLDSLSRVGLTFDNVWSYPTCTPTRAAMMSGKYGVKTGVLSPPGNLDLEHTSIFKAIEAQTNNAYADAVIGKWHISSGPIDITHPLQHGADYFDGVMRGELDDYYSWERVKDGATTTETTYATTALTNSAVDWVNAQTQPWLLWLAHPAPHVPFHVPPTGLFTTTSTNSNQQQYVAAIEAMDSEIGRLLSSMSPEVLANTVVIYVGDNGTPGRVIQSYSDDRGKGTLYQGGVHVPLIVAGKGVERKNEREEALVGIVDIYATILELAGATLGGGIYNSFSFQHLLTNVAGAKRSYNYTEGQNASSEGWTIRNDQYKLIQYDNGTQEFYDLLADPLETNDLNDNLTSAQLAVKEDLLTEATTIRTGWSCRDLILNGDEMTVDDCGTNVVDACDNDNSTSTTNIGCCDTPDFPSAYYETVENETRTIYTNNYPNHDYCYNPNNIPAPRYYRFEIPTTPQIAPVPTSVLRENNRPARYFGVSLNGVLLAPAPATPFIFENPQTGEYNWDWVFEPTNNQGDGRNLVALDCASGHTGPQGYHYHGNMFEYIETIQAGLSTTAEVPTAPVQIGWASDGFPILYRFGPNAEGNLVELQPSYQIKSGERAGDGITAPCGEYNGKYTNDYEYIAGLGDLDECNGINQSITLTSANGTETFDYFYVITSTFPQISRCLVGTPSASFDSGNSGLTNVIDQDQDGYVSSIDCDDTNAAINLGQTEILGNDIDENCDGNLLTSIEEFASFDYEIYPNPVHDYFVINLKRPQDFEVNLYSKEGKLVTTILQHPYVEVSDLSRGTYFLEIKHLATGQRVTEKLIVIE
ncbi:MAG: sulfatase-like hydrolase/transferase [Bacteroidota bacterium]